MNTVGPTEQISLLAANLDSSELTADRFRDDCHKIALTKYGNSPSPYIAARLKTGYFSPEDHYEAIVNRIVTTNVSWLDVGCGRAPFPNNLLLSAELSARCQQIVGIDPDSGIYENPFLRERHQMAFEQYSPTRHFDLVTARMVIEHVRCPKDFAHALFRATRPGSLVVFFTVNWWSITTLAAYLSPMSIHHSLKNLLWKTAPSDSFQTEYKMNRRNTLSSVMQNSGFRECMYWVLPDASLFWRIPVLRRLELAGFRLTRQCELPYVDTCILAAYRRASESELSAQA